MKACLRRKIRCAALDQGSGKSRSAGLQPVYPESFRGWSQCFQPADAPIDPAQRSWQRSADWDCTAIDRTGPSTPEPGSNDKSTSPGAACRLTGENASSSMRTMTDEGWNANDCSWLVLRY